MNSLLLPLSYIFGWHSAITPFYLKGSGKLKSEIILLFIVIVFTKNELSCIIIMLKIQFTKKGGN